VYDECWIAHSLKTTSETVARCDTGGKLQFEQ